MLVFQGQGQTKKHHRRVHQFMEENVFIENIPPKSGTNLKLGLGLYCHHHNHIHEEWCQVTLIKHTS